MPDKSASLSRVVAATGAKPAYAGCRKKVAEVPDISQSAKADFVLVVAVLTARHFSDIILWFRCQIENSKKRLFDHQTFKNHRIHIKLARYIRSIGIDPDQIPQ